MLLNFVAVSTFFFLLTAALCALTWTFYKFLKAVPKSRLSDNELPFVSIIVPARNEEGKIGRLIESLLKQDYPDFEIIIVDDRSTDRTAEIVESFARKDFRLKLVAGSDTPSGWIGKCNALAHAVGYASGKWFLFTDADTYHHPNSVRDAVSYGLDNKGDLVSFMPVQELGSFWERLVMPLLLGSFLLGDPFFTVNDPETERSYAYGQFVIARRSSYLAVGGHQSVRDEILEDHALSRVFKANGYRIIVADGKTLYSVRMYTNLKSMWQGWTKNLYSLIESRVSNLFLVLFVINCTVLYPFVIALALPELFNAGEHLINLKFLTGITGLHLLLVFLWYRKTSEHHTGVDWRHYFFLPFGVIAVSVLYVHAAYLVLSGSQVNWKGRRYRVNTSKTIQPVSHRLLDPALDIALGQDSNEIFGEGVLLSARKSD